MNPAMHPEEIHATDCIHAARRHVTLAVNNYSVAIIVFQL